jgi:hypothetical protein
MSATRARANRHAAQAAPGSPRTHETRAHGSTLALIDDSREELLATLRDDLASRVREVAELHSVILAQAKALESRAAALPATVEAASAPDAPKAAEPVEQKPHGWWERLRRAFLG